MLDNVYVRVCVCVLTVFNDKLYLLHMCSVLKYDAFQVLRNKWHDDDVDDDDEGDDDDLSKYDLWSAKLDTIW